MPEMNPVDRDKKEQLRRARHRKPPRKMLFPIGAACALANAHHLPDFCELFWRLYSILGEVL